MENPIKQIYKFNQQAGLLDSGYSDTLESSFQIEEALEGFDNLADLGKLFYLTPQESTPKQLSRDIVATAHNRDNPLSDVERLDKACDAVIFAVGSMAKLGLDPHQITKALNTVMHANLAKLTMHRDEYGKLTKPTDFVGPEVNLQKILDSRYT
jgi:predicted HAD superfamily Cof-like phosphohydrolase